LGDQNVKSNPKTVGSSIRDSEPLAKKLWEMSTAKIKNAPMGSPAELGLIHRGIKWQTINLKNFNEVQGIKEDAGGSDYALGDANILNQIKMSIATKNYKININTPHEEILTMLFEGIKVGKDKISSNVAKNAIVKKILDHTVSVNDSLDSPLLYDMETNNIQRIISKEAEYSENFFASRAEILIESDIQGVLIDNHYLHQMTDKEQEELIGKFINLTEAKGIDKSDQFNIIAVAQTIKDLGETGTFKKDTDQIIGTQKIHAKAYRDPATGAVRIKSFKYLGK
jgi:hypothetical protein